MWRISLKLNAYAVELEIAFLVIGVLQRLVIKPSFEKFVLMILLWFRILCRLMVKPIFHTRNWFRLIGPVEIRYEEYWWKSKSLFVLVVSVALRFGQKVFSGWYSDRMICSEKSVLWVNWNRPCSLKWFGERQGEI